MVPTEVVKVTPDILHWVLEMLKLMIKNLQNAWSDSIVFKIAIMVSYASNNSLVILTNSPRNIWLVNVTWTKHEIHSF